MSTAPKKILKKMASTNSGFRGRMIHSTLIWIYLQVFIFPYISGSLHVGTQLKRSSVSVVEGILAAAAVARAAVSKKNNEKSPNVTNSNWLWEMWLESSTCIRSDYRTMKATCTKQRIADFRDLCAVPTPMHRHHHQSKLYESLVLRTDLLDTIKVLELLKPAVLSLLPLRFNSSDLPAVIHQTWKSEDVGEETDFKEQMDAWEDDQWTHLIWTDGQLNRLISTVVPWMGPSIRQLPRPVDKIDCMRYILLFIFGGVYLDADMIRVNGNMNEMFRGLPKNGLAAGIDPAVISSFPHHPLLLQMLVWIVSRTNHFMNGGRHELTGPEGWRRTVHAYRMCEQEMDGHQHNYPTALFNQYPCSCWGVEVIPIDESSVDETTVRLIPIPGSGGMKAAGLMFSKDIPIRADSASLTRDIKFSGTSGLSKVRLHDKHTGPLLQSSLACVAYHRCSRIYGSGIEDWDGGWTLGNNPPNRSSV